MDENTAVKIEIDPEKLYYNMVEAKATWLYELPQWDEILTEERRKELTKLVRKTAEESKVAIRSIRRDAVDQVKKLKKNNEITEDDQKKAEEDIQKLTDAAIKDIDKIDAEKEKEIMEVK